MGSSPVPSRDQGQPSLEKARDSSCILGKEGRSSHQLFPICFSLWSPQCEKWPEGFSLPLYPLGPEAKQKEQYCELEWDFTPGALHQCSLWSASRHWEPSGGSSAIGPLPNSHTRVPRERGFALLSCVPFRCLPPPFPGTGKLEQRTLSPDWDHPDVGKTWGC